MEMAYNQAKHHYLVPEQLQPSRVHLPDTIDDRYWLLEDSDTLIWIIRLYTCDTDIQHIIRQAALLHLV